MTKKRVTDRHTTWGIINSSGMLLPFTVAQTRRDSISELVYLGRFTWEQYYRKGYRARKLTISWEE